MFTHFCWIVGNIQATGSREYRDTLTADVLDIYARALVDEDKMDPKKTRAYLEGVRK